LKIGSITEWLNITDLPIRIEAQQRQTKKQHKTITQIKKIIVSIIFESFKMFVSFFDFLIIFLSFNLVYVGITQTLKLSVFTRPHKDLDQDQDHKTRSL
jgi:hypothetical protein